MNERDYMLGEAMTLTAGALVLATIICVFISYGLTPDMGIIIAMAFVGFTTFFFGLYFHMKRRIYVLENESLLKEHRKDT